MQDLLKLTNLSHLLIIDDKIPIDRSIGFNEVDQLKDKLILKSKSFLTEALSLNSRGF